MSVITISRTLGSGGDYIGRKLASELGYKYIDKEKISDIIKDYGIIKLDDIYNSISHFWDRMDEYRHATVNFLTDTIIAIAQHGNVVIAGRGSFGILHNFSGVIHVRIQAPFEERVMNEADRLGVGIKEAELIVRKDDHYRKKFIESYFFFEPGDVSLFDAVLDTSVVDLELCVKILKQICENAEPDVRNRTCESLDDFETDEVLQNHITEKLG